MTRPMVGKATSMRGTIFVLCAACSLVQNARADKLSLDLNNDAARVTFVHPFASNNTQIDASWLHHQDLGDAVSVGFQLTGNAASESRPVNAGLGGRVYFLDSEVADDDGSALAVGGFVDAKLPTYDRIGFSAHLYYGPDVLSFGGLEEAIDFEARAAYSVLRDGEVYLGLRTLRGDFENRSEAILDSGMFVGFSLQF